MKYEFAAGQRHLPLHVDQSELSLTIALNGQCDDSEGGGEGGEALTFGGLTFGGGGTYFESLGKALVPEAGGLVAFPGDLSHGGMPITRGET